jgi:hypothetical protein
MATDNKTGQAIFGGHNSWGRTRGPKNLAGSPGTAITALANTNTLKGVSASTAGYATENQRYLHVLIEETNDGSDTNAPVTTIYGYCHAFERWFELPQSFDPVGTNSGPDAASVDAVNSSTTPANHVPASREYRTYQILGIDRVAFVNATAATVNIFAACSTF